MGLPVKNIPTETGFSQRQNGNWVRIRDEQFFKINFRNSDHPLGDH